MTLPELTSITAPLQMVRGSTNRPSRYLQTIQTTNRMPKMVAQRDTSLDLHGQSAGRHAGRAQAPCSTQLTSPTLTTSYDSGSVHSTQNLPNLVVSRCAGNRGMVTIVVKC